MSNIDIFKSGVPAYLKSTELDDITKNLLGGGDSGKRISIKGGTFRLIANGQQVAVKQERYIDVVIVGAQPKVSRTFYAGKFKEGETGKRPDCSSFDGVTPDSSVKAPQHSSCQGCPQDVKGSGQGDTKACRFSKNLAVVLADELDGDVYQITLPAMSIFGRGTKDTMPLQHYGEQLGAHGVPVSAVVTRIQFDVDSSTPKLFFTAIRPLNEKEYELAKAASASREAKNAVSKGSYELDAPTAPAIAAPVTPVAPPVAAPAPARKPKPAPAPEPEITDVEVKEPTVRATGSNLGEAFKVAPQGDIKSLLDEWNDDDDDNG
jgi:hypothetical protein